MTKIDGRNGGGEVLRTGWNIDGRRDIDSMVVAVVAGGRSVRTASH